jgi:uncharacterized membrane protein YkoI
MRHLGFAVALVVLAGLSSASQTASAQGVQIGPGGVRIDPGFRPGRPDRIGRREAIEIARERGMIDVDSVERREDEYRVRGEDRRGRRMRVSIDAYTGRVLEVVRRD